MAKLAQSLGLDLPDPLAGHVEVAPDLLEGPRPSVLQAEAELEHPALPRGERVQHALHLLLEELVGYVSDELRRHEEEFVEVDERTFQVDGGMTVHDANEELEIDLPEDEDYETIGGFVLARLGRIPDEGEQFTHEGLRFTVDKVEGNRIEEVTIKRL